VVPALAQAAPHWVIGTSTLGAGETAAVSSSGGTFELKVEELGVVIKCSAESNTGTLKGGEPGTDEATVTFTGCKLFDLSGTQATACVVHSEGAANETIVSEVNTELIQPGGAGTTIYDRFTSKAGQPFTTIAIDNAVGKHCAAGLVEGEEAYSVTGNTAGETESGLRVTQPLRFSAAISTATSTELKFGESTATLTGTSNETLPGHPGVNWGAE
jgi:hypothetical protein